MSPLIDLPAHCLRDGLSLSLEFTGWVKLVSSGVHLSVSPGQGFQVHSNGIRTWVPVAVQQALH